MARGRDAMDRTGLEREGRLGRTAKYSFHGDERNNIEMESGFYFMGPRGDKKKGREFKPIRRKHHSKHVNISQL
jgi:hypothetical protein